MSLKIHRKQEMKELNQLFHLYQKKDEALLIGIDGRRRVGKTTFVKDFIKQKEIEYSPILGGVKKFTLSEMDRLIAKAENVQYIYGDDVNVNIILLGCNPIHFPQREYLFPVQSLLWYQE